MNKRNIQLSLEEAKKLYNNGDPNMKSLILTSFTKEELTTPKFTDIKSFWDACDALDLDKNSVQCDLNRFIVSFEANTNKHLRAIYKLDIIRKALNGDWKPSFTQGNIYYPYIRFYSAGLEATRVASNNNWKLCETFEIDGKKYTLTGGDYNYTTNGGISLFDCWYGCVQPILGLLCCKSKGIAGHMSRYFAKEIFEANYAQHVGTYKWV